MAPAPSRALPPLHAPLFPPPLLVFFRNRGGRRSSHRKLAAFFPAATFSASSQEYQSPPAFRGIPGVQVVSGPPWRGPLRTLSQHFKTSGFSMLAGRCLLNRATTFSAAMHAIFVLVSRDADAMCGASTTFARFRPG